MLSVVVQWGSHQLPLNFMPSLGGKSLANVKLGEHQRCIVFLGLAHAFSPLFLSLSLSLSWCFSDRHIDSLITE